MQINKLIGIFNVKNLLPVCLLIFLTGCASFDLAPPEPSSTPVTEPLEVLKTTLDMKEQWRYQTGLPNTPYSIPAYLKIADGKAIILSYAEGVTLPADYSQAGRPMDSSLTALSIDSGRVVWQTRYLDFEGAGGNTMPDNILLQPESNRVYIAYSSVISAFNLETGEQIWTSPRMKGSTDYYFAPELSTNERLVVRSRLKELNTIDVQTGDLLAQEPTGEPFNTAVYGQIVVTKSYENLGVGKTKLAATDRSTGQGLWEKVVVELFFDPVFIENGVLFAYGSYENRLLHYCEYVDIYTGGTLWTTDQAYVSNFVVSDGRVYALRQDGSLVALDLKDGQILGEIKFNREITNLSRPYWVAASGPHVLVYFGDSQELIAFKQDH